MNRSYSSLCMILLCFVCLLLPNILIVSPVQGSNKLPSNPLAHYFFLNNRLIIYQEPSTPMPEDGYPVLFLLHGAAQYPFAWFLPINRWNIKQSLFRKQAVEEGIFVIVPSSGRPMRLGPHAWNSYVNEFSESEDLQLFHSLFQWISNRSTTVDLNSVFCAGFSSGGFMTSRLAKVFPEQLAKVLIHSGADADSITFTNRGPEFDCKSPINYSANHPPTLIIHGEKDQIVPFACGSHLYQELQRNNISSALFTDQEKGHIWLSSFSDTILSWFLN